MKIQNFIKHRINIWSVNMINTITASYHQGICNLEEMCCQGKSRVWTGFNHSWPHCQSSWWGELTQKPRNRFPNILFSQIFSSIPYMVLGIGLPWSVWCSIFEVTSLWLCLFQIVCCKIFGLNSNFALIVYFIEFHYLI